MSMSLDCSLFFGYDVGGSDSKWNIDGYGYDEETDTYNWPEWVKLYLGDDQPNDLTDDMIDFLLPKMAGFEVIHWDYTGTDPRPADYYKQYHEAKERLGFSADVYGTDGYSGTVFGYEILSGDYGLKALDSAKLDDIDFGAMEERLGDALRYLGITFTDQPEPRLLLLSSYM